MRILVVEDDPVLSRGLAELLEGAGHEALAVRDGVAAVEQGTAQAFDLVVLDLGLPKLDGLEVSRRLRMARPGLPLLMLTSRADEKDVVEGFRSGADDYVKKPFSPRELLARVAVFARRNATVPREPDVVDVDGIHFDFGKCEAVRDGEPHRLTVREVGILRLLFRHRERAVERRELLEQVWGVPGHLSTRTVDMAISTLRQKIETDPRKPRIVRSVKGVGYAWGQP